MWDTDIPSKHFFWGVSLWAGTVPYSNHLHWGWSTENKQGAANRGAEWNINPYAAVESLTASILLAPSKKVLLLLLLLLFFSSFFQSIFVQLNFFWWPMALGMSIISPPPEIEGLEGGNRFPMQKKRVMYWNYRACVFLFGVYLRKLTWQWNIHHLKMDFLLKLGIFQCHVSFQGCMLQCWILSWIYCVWGFEACHPMMFTVKLCVISMLPAPKILRCIRFWVPHWPVRYTVRSSTVTAPARPIETIPATFFTFTWWRVWLLQDKLGNLCLHKPNFAVLCEQLWLNLLTFYHSEQAEDSEFELLRIEACMIYIYCL